MTNDATEVMRNLRIAALQAQHAIALELHHHVRHRPGRRTIVQNHQKAQEILERYKDQPPERHKLLWIELLTDILLNQLAFVLREGLLRPAGFPLDQHPINLQVYCCPEPTHDRQSQEPELQPASV